MKKNVGTYLLMVSTLVLSFMFVQPATQASADGSVILKFGTMVGIPKPLTGAQNPIRGIDGGGLPWVISSAQGILTAAGKLNVEVKGLVLDPNDPTVIARGLAGQNPISSFRVTVSCLTMDGGVMNVATDPFPATTGPASSGGGNAQISTSVDLPHPCIAPIIFVTSPGGAWFSITGN